VSDEEIQGAWTTAHESGEMADIQKARQLENKRHQANQLQIQRDLQKQINLLQEQGTQWIGGVQEKFAKQALESKEHYQTYKKEIDAQIAQVPIQQRTPEILEAVYKYVIGDKQEEIFTRRMEANARKAQEDAVADSNARTARGQGGGMNTEDETFAGVFGETLAQQGARWEGGGDLWSGRHRNPNEFAQNLGYENADAYAKAATVIMSIQDCPNCFSPMTEAAQGEQHQCPVPSTTHRLSIPGLR
jgi:hypothetical protein